MKQFAKLVVAAIVAVSMLSAAVPAQAQSVAAPTLTVNREGASDSYRITVYGQAYGYINELAYRTSGSSLWTKITGLGTLDGSGYYTTVLSFGHAGPVEMYAMVNSRQSPIVQVNPGGCMGVHCEIFTLTPNSLSLRVGESSVVNSNRPVVLIYPPVNSFYISNNSNPSVASASVSGSSMAVTANQAGSTTITGCATNGGQCASVFVTVTGGGNFWLSQNSVTVSQGQSVSVNAHFSNPVSGNLYVSNNTNSNVVQVLVSGSSLSVYGSNPGNATVTICHTVLGQCQNLAVTVQGGTTGNLYFNTISLPQMHVGQYYGYQLSVSGGTSPYVFTIQSGSLPAGLSLSSGGQIFGTPQNISNASFTVRVTDYYGRTATQWFGVAPQCQNWSGSGCVLGGSTYANGQLINENGTVYVIYKNTKTPFASREAFEGLGFSFANVLNVGNTGLPSTGYVIRTAQASHPWGSWVKSGHTVYFVHESGLVPVPNYYTFQNNGGQDRFVVQANTRDFQRPMLSVMVENDPRLK